MISINISELIWTVINFFLLLFLLNRFLYKPVISFMEERQARIDAKLRLKKSKSTTRRCCRRQRKPLFRIARMRKRRSPRDRIRLLSSFMRRPLNLRRC